jgi:hypothetical protein
MIVLRVIAYSREHGVLAGSIHIARPIVGRARDLNMLARQGIAQISGCNWLFQLNVH